MIFKVVIEGRNLLCRVDGVRQRLGFVTTRFVGAQDEQEAISVAREAVLKEYGPRAENQTGDPPRWELVSIAVAPGVALPEGQSGATWYEEE